MTYCEVERVHYETRFVSRTIAVYVLGRQPSGGALHVLHGSEWHPLEENVEQRAVEATFEIPEDGLELLAAAIDKMRQRPALDAVALADAKQVRDRALGMVEDALRYFLEPPEPPTTERIRSV